MQEIFLPSKIAQYTMERAQLEVDMCRKLYDVYNGGPILYEITKTISFAFENVFLHVLAPGKYKSATDEAVKEGKILQVFAKHAGGAPTAQNLPDKCRAILDNRWSWDAADCSDLSRLIGSVLEKSKGTGGENWKGFESEYTKHKPDEFYKNDAKAAGRSRAFSPGGALPGSVGHSTVGRNAGLEARIKISDGAGGSLDSGITPFRLTEFSTVRKIDVAFGLPEGADISGTTSDSIIVNQLVAKFVGAISASPNPPLPSTSKLLQLLPLVTMISHGHHTLLESALTLTLFGVCEYQIGFYTSLFSSAVGAVPTYDEGGSIMTILSNAETDRRNKHILCWYDIGTRQYAGLLYETPEEIRQYRRFATTGEGFLKFFRHNVHASVYKSDLAPLLSGAYKEARRVVI